MKWYSLIPKCGIPTNGNFQVAIDSWPRVLEGILNSNWWPHIDDLDNWTFCQILANIMLKRIPICFVILRWLRALKSPTSQNNGNMQMPRDKKNKIKITSLRIPQNRDCFYNLKGASYIWWDKVNQDLRQFLMDWKEKPIVARVRNNLVNHTDLSLKQRTAPIYAEL